MRNRRNTNVKTIKDYIVPIITFLLIFALLYIIFSGNDESNIDTSGDMSTNISTGNTNEITITLDDSDSKVTLIDENEKKTPLLEGDGMNPGQTIIVENGSISFSIPDEADFSLNKNGELKYQKNSKMNLLSSALWAKSKNDIEVDMKFANIKIGKNSVVNLEQNEVSSTVYLLKGSAEVENLSGISTFLSQGKQIKISNKNASDEDLDIAALKEDFDDYFKISDWYLQNNGGAELLDINPTDPSDDSVNEKGLTEDSSNSTLGDGNDIKNPLITSQLLNFDNITDEGSVPTAITKISGKFANDSIGGIEIQGKKASINMANKTFTIDNINTGNQSNDIVIKVLDIGDNIMAKYVYTLYYSSGKTENTVTNGFATINKSAYPVNGSDFIVSIPSVVNGVTYSDKNSMYGTVKNPDIASVLINGFKLGTFNGKTFRYHAYKSFNTLGEGVNNYEIKYLGKDGKVIFKKYIAIEKKTKIPAPATIPTPVE